MAKHRWTSWARLGWTAVAAVAAVATIPVLWDGRVGAAVTESPAVAAPVTGHGELHFAGEPAEVVDLGEGTLWWRKAVPVRGSMTLTFGGSAHVVTFAGHDWQLLDIVARTVVIYAERTYQIEGLGSCDEVAVGQLPGSSGPLADFASQLNCDDGSQLQLLITDNAPIMVDSVLAGWTLAGGGQVPLPASP